jgi:hypothetical protein
MKREYLWYEKYEPKMNNYQMDNMARILCKFLCDLGDGEPIFNNDYEHFKANFKIRPSPTKMYICKTGETKEIPEENQPNLLYPKKKYSIETTIDWGSIEKELETQLGDKLPYEEEFIGFNDTVVKPDYGEDYQIKFVMDDRYTTYFNMGYNSTE